MEERTVPHIRIPIPKSSDTVLVPCLIVIEGGPVGDIFRISKASVSIGRGSTNDICLTVEGVSRQHARLDIQGNLYTITDLGSTNGTMVNGKPTEQGSLKNGDEISLGEVLLRFSLHAPQDLEHHERVRSSAVKDPLTGVANKEFFLDTLKRELNYAFRQRSSLTLAMVEVTNLETLRHHYGQISGDEVLKAVAQQLQEGLRAYDLLARYSEAEFAILLRDTALENALIFANRALRCLTQLAFDADGKIFHAHTALGLATANPDYLRDVDGLVREAEHYLSQAKTSGQDKIASARS